MKLVMDGVMGLISVFAKWVGDELGAWGFLIQTDEFKWWCSLLALCLNSI